MVKKLSLISKSETFIYFRFITCKVKHIKGFFFFFFFFWWLELTANESKKSLSQNIRIFPKINEKKDLQNRKVQVPASLSCGMDAISLRHCSRLFSSSGLLDRLFLIVLLKISHRFHMGFSSGILAGQSSTVILWSAKHLEMVLAVWAGAKVLLENEISISIKLVSRWKHKVL